jgi:hypothetical protein
MSKVSIRYKTDAKPNDIIQWRVIIDGVEYGASNVIINCVSHTTKDYIQGVGEKWHITCEPKFIRWADKECILI